MKTAIKRCPMFKKKPDEVLENLRSKLIGEDKIFGSVMITTLIFSFLCYFYEMITGLGCPDTLCEGVHFYRNSDYSTSQARWMLRFINEIGGKNVIIPIITILGYCFMIGIATYIIIRMIHLKSRISAVFLTALMVSFPIILHHFAFLYMALAYSFSFPCWCTRWAGSTARKKPWKKNACCMNKHYLTWSW